MLSRERLFNWSRVSGGLIQPPRASASKRPARNRPHQSGKWTSGLRRFPTTVAISR